jgi:type IV secretion system protein VirB6
MTLAACAPTSAGTGFLKSSLVYLDCAGRTIGSVGYTSLIQPGSIISQLIFVAITLFVAWQGVRLMFGRIPEMGDAVIGAAKIGLVLMLVTSWPAARALFAGPSFAGPVELVTQTGIQGPVSLEDRLQRADDGIVNLTKWGTGKLDIRAGRTADGKPAASEFAGVALTDSLALGLGRLCFLIGTLMSFGLLKLLTGVMISALPIFAGFLMFDATRALFAGWLRLVFALFVASFAVPLLLATELTLLEPWLARAIEQRAAFYATPSAPTELLAISGSFLLILIGSTALIAKACFAANLSALGERMRSWNRSDAAIDRADRSPMILPAGEERTTGPSRAENLAFALGRADRVSSVGAIQNQRWSEQPADNDAVRIDTNQPGQFRPGRRVRQRVTLSHARRNQR